ncbi:MAG: TetR/AcrR family transcriptional regulator [Sphingomonadales bacterium]|nr:TetR/AcrR family transcriptional regulator [Sphingomonadales bacterium]
MATPVLKTRDRIVEAARRLFNERGYGEVTTAALASHLGMAEGNLWYHFKTKRALLEAIAAHYADSIAARLRLHPGMATDCVEDYVALLKTCMHEFRTFRFLFRDQATYGEHVESISAQAPHWLEASFVQFEEHLAALVDHRLLDWPRGQLRDLAINATIILRYGLEHFREMGEPTAEGTGAVRKTLLRHLTLFDHALEPVTADRLRTAIGRMELEALAEAA